MCGIANFMFHTRSALVSGSFPETAWQSCVTRQATQAPWTAWRQMMIRRAMQNGMPVLVVLDFCDICDVVTIIYMREYELLWMNLAVLVFICWM